MLHAVCRWYDLGRRLSIQSSDLERTEMRMLRWILEVSLKDRKRNKDIRQAVGVAGITDKILEARLRWYGNVQRREDDSCVKKIMKAELYGRRSRGCQKKRWSDMVQQDLVIDASPQTRGCCWQTNGDGEPMWLTQEINTAWRRERYISLLKVLTTLPVTAASAERTFSMLSSLKTWLRSTMAEDRLTGLYSVACILHRYHSYSWCCTRHILSHKL